MAKFKILKKKVTHWDGDPQTGAEYGWGDYRSVEWEAIATVDCLTEREARKEARKLFKAMNEKCYFSRTGINCLIEEIK